MEIHFSSEEEVKLIRIASKEGTAAEEIVKRAALKLLADDERFRAAVREGIAQAEGGELIEEKEMNARLEQMLRP